MIKLVTQVWEYRCVYVWEVGERFGGLTQNLCLFLMEQRNLKFFSQISYKTLLFHVSDPSALFGEVFPNNFVWNMRTLCHASPSSALVLPLPGQCEFPSQDFVPMICGFSELQRSLYLLVYSRHSFMLFECMDGEESCEHTERTGGEQNHGS